jgi:hypothetical protein
MGHCPAGEEQQSMSIVWIHYQLHAALQKQIAQQTFMSQPTAPRDKVF